MSKVGFTLDIKGFERQINKLKKNIELGIRDGFKDSQQFLIDRMTFYVTQEVYDAYTNPDQSDPNVKNVYHRTYELQNSIKAKVIGNSIYIYSEGVDYAERVLKGHEAMGANGYDYPWIGKNATGDFLKSRDWITPTREEIIEHFNQSAGLKQIIIDAIKQRI